MPQVDRDAGSQRTFDLITMLQEDGWKATFVSQHDQPADRYATALRRRGVAVFVGAQWVERLVASCGGRLRLDALIEETAVVDRILLRHLGLPTAIPARAPPLLMNVPDGSGWPDEPSEFDACS